VTAYRPTPRARIWVALMIVAAAGVLGSACGSSAESSSATTTASPGVTVPRVPVRDRFVGTLHGGTGSLAGARDVVEVRLQAPGSGGVRRLTLWIVGSRCPAGAKCVHPSGSLRGQLTRVHSLPDVGRRYAIEASGSLGQIGVMTAAGTVAGTGNINFGFESLQLTLTGKRGSSRLSARSSRVPAFTSP
jgi:hypothetical protein